MQEILSVQHLNKFFDTKHVLQDINFSLHSGDVLTLVGSSGSGKSTLLRCINLLETVHSGSIIFNNQNLLSGKININVIRQKIGMVFQSFNLFENYSVLGNCILAPLLTQQISSRNKAKELAMHYLNKVGMDHFAHARVNKLSGGQKQRVAIARALCMRGDLLLFDEPTSALDPESVGEVLMVMKELATEGMSMIVVTHEMSFAKHVANRVLFMNEGTIVEDTTSHQFFTNPVDPRIKKFLARFTSS